RLGGLGYAGGATEELDAAELVALEPALDARSVVAGFHAQVDRFVRPEQLTAGLASSLRADGAEIREHTELSGLAREHGSIALETSTGRETADRVVVAA